MSITNQQQQQQQQQLPPFEQQEMTLTNLLMRLIVSGQNNITHLIEMQKQQMIYTDKLFKEVINEQQQQQAKTQTTASQPINNDSQSPQTEGVSTKTTTDKQKV